MDLDLGGSIVRGLSADFAVTGSELIVENIVFKDPPGRVSGLRMRVEDFFEAPYMRDFSVSVSRMGFEEVKDILASDIVSALPFLAPTEGGGGVRGNLALDTPLGDTPGIPVMTGEIEFYDWSLSVPFFTATFQPTEATLIFKKDRMEIPPLEVRFDESYIFAEGKLMQFDEPLLVMSIEAPAMDLIELFGTGEGTLLFEDFSSRLIFEEGYVLLDGMEFSLYGGMGSGDWGYIYTDLHKDEERTAKTEAEYETLFFMNLVGTDIDIGRLFTDTGTWEDIRGTLTADCSLTSDPGSPELVLKTLDGSGSFEVIDGTIIKLDLFSKIFSLLQISNYLRLKFPKLDEEGIPFDSITGDFEITDGMVTTQNLFMESRVIRVSGVGSVDLVAREIDMILGFQVLETIDLIVNKIPVVGYILTGDDGNLFTTYFRVTGPLDDPEVSPLTLQALGEGTLHIFERIYNFPLRGLLPR
jgi:hypothetical protein